MTVEQAKLMQDQAQLLLEIDDISYQVANAIVNIKRYEELVKLLINKLVVLVVSPK